MEHIIFKEGAARGKILGGEAALDKFVNFAESGAQREVADLIRHGANPDFEKMAAACDVLRRELAGAAGGLVLDVGVVAGGQAAALADGLVEPAAGIAVLPEP